MSVLILDPKCMEYIHAGFIMAAYRTQCDQYYSETIRSYCRDKDIHEVAQIIVTGWAMLNELSYCVAYKEAGQSYHQFIRFTRHWDVKPVQLMKYIECLLYNIDLETIKCKESFTQGEVKGAPEVTPAMREMYALLKSWERDIKNAILHALPEYDGAHWSEAPDKVNNLPPYLQHKLLNG